MSIGDNDVSKWHLNVLLLRSYVLHCFTFHSAWCCFVSSNSNTVQRGVFCLCVSGNGWIAVRLEEEEEEEKAKQTVESFHCTLLSKWLSLLPWCAGCSSSCTSSTKFSVRVLLLLFFCCFFISSWLFNRVILPRVLVIWSIYLFFSSLRHYCYLLPGICLCAL